jgi:hypothetical protein
VESEVGLGTSFFIRLPGPGDGPFAVPPAAGLNGRAMEGRT